MQQQPFSLNFQPIVILLLIFFLHTQTASGKLIFQDDFEDGDYSTAEGNDGLSWQAIQGNATIRYYNNQTYQLGVNRGGSFVVTDQSINKTEFTIGLEVYLTWSVEGRLVFLYQDQDNYYSLCFGNNPGIYRMRNGVEMLVAEDVGSLIRLPHASNATGYFKIHVQVDTSKILIEADRDSDGVDYDISYKDTSPESLNTFTQGGIGLLSAGGSEASPWFYIDNLTVDDTKIVDDRDPVTYYIDATAGDDNRSPIQASNPSTPWQTIQKAANVMWSGDTAVVMPGIYRESVTPQFSGMNAKPITYRAYDPTNKPILDGSVSIGQSGWQSVEITDFHGTVRSVYKTQIEWTPQAVFQDGIRMFESQEPNQSDSNDTYNHLEFREVPSAYNDGSSTTILVDPNFLIQPENNFWNGATLMLYDGFANLVVTSKITGYQTATNQITVAGFSRFIGNDHDKDDRYALRNHLSLIDQPGEYYVDTSTTPYELYVFPYPGKELSTITAAKLVNGFDLSAGYRKNILFNGFEIRNFSGNGVAVGTGCRNIEVEKSDIHHIMGDGVSVDSSDTIIVSGTYLHDNYDNGVSFGYGQNYSVTGCEVTANGNNGIWVGTGGGSYFNAYNILIKDNFIHHQGGLRAHPDNYQMHQVKNIIMEGNVMIQDGHQNMWTQYSENFTIRNNIFIGGTLGINSTMHSYVYHNAFYKSGLRYDAHLTDHPTSGDYYKPQDVRIKNNMIVESSITMPDDNIVDWSVYSIDHNYYNIENRWLRGSWGDRGVGFGEGSIVSADSSTLKNIIKDAPDDQYDNFDFHHKIDSPCINGGIDVGVHLDMEKYSRHTDGAPDIGPYEYHTFPWMMFLPAAQKR